MAVTLEGCSHFRCLHVKDSHGQGGGINRRANSEGPETTLIGRLPGLTTE